MEVSSCQLTARSGSNCETALVRLTICTSLAAHGVDIVRLDVVSHEGPLVVDDLFVSANSQDDIGAAISSFQPDVLVRTFDQTVGDPVLEMGGALTAIARADSLESARSASVSGGIRLLRSDVGALLQATMSGGFEVLTGPPSLPELVTEAPFAGRRCLQRGTAIAFPVSEAWAPAAFQQALGGSWMAIAPCGQFAMLLVARRLNIAFHVGELERFAVYAEAAGGTLAAPGQRPIAGSIPAGAEEPLPPRGLSLDSRLAVP
jgi:hypothetical protein